MSLHGISRAGLERSAHGRTPASWSTMIPAHLRTATQPRNPRHASVSRQAAVAAVGHPGPPRNTSTMMSRNRSQSCGGRAEGPGSVPPITNPRGAARRLRTGFGARRVSGCRRSTLRRRRSRRRGLKPAVWAGVLLPPLAGPG